MMLKKKLASILVINFAVGCGLASSNKFVADQACKSDLLLPSLSSYNDYELISSNSASENFALKKIANNTFNIESKNMCVCKFRIDSGELITVFVKIEERYPVEVLDVWSE